MKFERVSALILLAAVFLASCSTNEVRDRPKDDALAKQLQSTLFERRDLPMEGVTVQVIDTVVYLYGIVDTELQRSLIEDVARSTSGITNVVNSIGVRNSIH